MLRGLPSCPPKLLHSLLRHFRAKGFERSTGGKRPFPLCSRTAEPAGPGSTVIRSRPSLTFVSHLDCWSVWSIVIEACAKKSKGDVLPETEKCSVSSEGEESVSSSVLERGRNIDAAEAKVNSFDIFGVSRNYH